MKTNSPPLIETIRRDQVAMVVHHFYQRVLSDELLAPFFTDIHNWPQHEAFITDFWWGVMGGRVEAPRPGAMASGHRGLGITPSAMSRWLALFGQSIDELVAPAAALQWQAMAQGIARMMAAQGLVEE